MTSPSSQVIPEAAVEAAKEAIDETFSDRALDCWPDFEKEARAALEAAAPYATFHSPEDLLLGVYTMTGPELQETLRTAKAEAWDEGLKRGAVGAYIHPDEYALNPYRPTA